MQQLFNPLVCSALSHPFHLLKRIAGLQAPVNHGQSTTSTAQHHLQKDEELQWQAAIIVLLYPQDTVCDPFSDLTLIIPHSYAPAHYTP